MSALLIGYLPCEKTMVAPIAQEIDQLSHGLIWALGRLAQHRDQQAWAMLVLQVGPDIKRLAVRLVGDISLADDAVQETLMLVRDCAGRFVARGNDEAGARRWIMGVASNACLQLLRRYHRQINRDRKAGNEAAQFTLPPVDPADGFANEDERLMLRRELAALPAIYGQALTLHFFADQDYQILAVQLRVSVNTVRTRVHRGLIALRERLARCGMTLSLTALTGLLTNLGAMTLESVALPTSALEIITSNSMPTTTFVSSSSFITMSLGITKVLAILFPMLSIALAAMLFGWFDSINSAPTPLSSISAKSGLLIPVEAFVIVVQTDKQKTEARENETFRLFSEVIDGRPRLTASGPNQFTLPLFNYSAYDFSINWGDGIHEVVTTSSTNPTHTYEHAGTYQIQITENVRGGFPRIYFNDEGDRSKILEISQWGNVTWSSMERAFTGCEHLMITASDAASARTSKVTNFSFAWSNCHSLTTFPLLDTSSGTDFSFAWANCHSLKSFPLLDTGTKIDLYSMESIWHRVINSSSGQSTGTRFSYAWSHCRSLTAFPLLNTAAGTDFQGSWSGCEKLTSFPLLDTAAGTNFQRAWSGCSNLTNFPHLNTAAGKDFSDAWSLCRSLSSFPQLDTSAGNDFSGAWSDCGSLISFPQLNTKAGINFSKAWSYCDNLTSFPLLNTASGIDFSDAWSSCRSLISFPLLDTAAGKDFGGAWSHCAKLTELPQLNTAAGIDFSFAWSQCKSLKTFPQLNTAAGTNFKAAWLGCDRLVTFPQLKLGNMQNGEHCLSGVMLDQNSYDKLLTNLAALNTKLNVNFDGGFATANSLAAHQAREILIGRGWEIVDGKNKQAPRQPLAKPKLKTEEANEF